MLHVFLRGEKFNQVRDLARAWRSSRKSFGLLGVRDDHPVAQSGSMISGMAGRYAGSLFELAKEAKAISTVEADLDRFEALLEGSDDLQRLVNSPVFSADDQLKAVGAVLDKAKITGLVGNFLRVVAKNRRLFAVPQIIRAFRQIAAEDRGETTAEVPLGAVPPRVLLSTLLTPS